MHGYLCHDPCKLSKKEVVEENAHDDTSIIISAGAGGEDLSWTQIGVNDQTHLHKQNFKLFMLIHVQDVVFCMSWMLV